MEIQGVSESERLANQLKQAETLLPEALQVRLHRAISWLRAAEQTHEVDFRFVSLWIAFSACSSIDQLDQAGLANDEHFLAFVKRLIENDQENRIYHCLWHEYSTHVKALIRNPYVYQPFWRDQRLGSDAWQQEFDRSSVAALNALARGRVDALFAVVLDRLFVLRNQLVNGGATFQSRVNREQVENGAGILGTLLPICIDIMQRGRQIDWGPVAYPVVNRALLEQNSPE